MASPDILFALADRHPAGIFCRKQVFRAGCNDRDISRWVADEVIERLAPGWYRLSARPRHPQMHLHLPLDYTRFKRAGAVPRLSGGAGMQALDLDDPQPDEPPLLLVDRGARIRVRNPPWRHRHAELSGTRLLRPGRFRVASGARVLADLAEDGVAEDKLLVACDQVRNRLRTTTVDLIREWQGMRLAGARRMLAIAATGALDVESSGERTALDVLFGSHPPAPDLQVQVTERRRADYAFVFAALILEYHGEDAHSGQVDADAVRASEITAPGWDHMVITKTMVQPAWAARTAAQVHRRRTEREALMMEGRLRRPPLPVQPPRRTPLRTLAPLG